MLRKSSVVVIVTLSAFIALAGETKYPCVGEKAPTFVLRNTDGMMVSLHLLCGEKVLPQQRKVVVLDFFQVTCKPCIEELPAIKKFYAAWKSDQRVHFFMVGVGETTDSVREFKERYDARELPVLCDSYLVTSRSFGFTTFPVAMIVDRDRVIRLIIRNKQPNIDEILTQNLETILIRP